MSRSKSRGSRPHGVSATELSQMGVCERRMVFEQKHGQRRAIDQQLAIQRGMRSHQRFHRDRSRGPSAISRWVCAAFRRIASGLRRWMRELGGDDGR